MQYSICKEKSAHIETVSTRNASQKMFGLRRWEFLFSYLEKRFLFFFTMHLAENVVPLIAKLEHTEISARSLFIYPYRTP